MSPRVALEPGYHKLFVELCVENKLQGNMLVLQHLVEPFQQKTHMRFNMKQLKSHWDAMVKQWKIWSKLVQCNDMKWDRKTKTFGASDEDWTKYLQANPDAGSYRFSPPLFLKKIETIFEGSNFECRVYDESGSSERKRKRGNKEETDTGENGKLSLSEANIPTPKRRKWKWWPRASHELFIDLLVQETSKGNRPIRHWAKKNWSMIVETVKRNTENNYTINQVRSHWYDTKNAWKLWCQTIGADIMKWDPKTQTFGATDEDWKRYIEENPRAANFRRKQIPCADKLAIIFKADVESPQLHNPTPLPTFSTNETVTENEDEPDDDDDEINKKMVSTKRHKSTIVECIECLTSLQEVEEGSSLYLFALDLFLKKEYREIFLQLKNSSSRMSWILKLQSDRTTKLFFI